MSSIPVYESWEWKPKRNEIVLVSRDGTKWSAEFFHHADYDEYGSPLYYCAQMILPDSVPPRYEWIYPWNYIAKPQDILSRKEHEA